ncbi:MAG: phenylacetate--CoA ligase family protein [Acidimicrobiales bacterium]
MRLAVGLQETLTMVEHPDKGDADAEIRWTVAHAASGSAWWREHFERADVDVRAVRGLADLPKLPFTTKQDLRDAYPLGWLSVPDAGVSRVHASSGTTGKRTVCAYTAKDLDDWAEGFARCFRSANVTFEDRVQVMVGYGLWTAGSGFQAGAERLGAMVVPTGPGNVETQLEMMLDLGVTVICSTSSFALLLAEQVVTHGLRDSLRLKTAIIGSERWSDGMRAQIEQMLGVESFDIYGLTELYGPGMGIDCPLHEGIHLWSDLFVVEIVDPDTLEVLEPGKAGEIVLTTLRKEAMPLIRYRTRDRSWLYPEPCGCGSPYPRIGRLMGRTDDMVKVRGVAVFPAQVDSVLSSIPGIGPEYQVHVSRTSDLRDRFVVRVEAEASSELGPLLADQLRQALGIRPEVETVPVGSLPRSAGKTRRVFDHRLEDAGEK